MTFRTLRMCVTLVALPIAVACGRGAGSVIATTTSGPTGRLQRDVITHAELSDPTIRDLTVLEVVRRLRPSFLADRGVQSKETPESGRVHASVDGIAVLPLDELQSIPVSAISEIRYLNPGAAQLKFGMRAYAGPVILVLTNAGG